MDFTTVPGAFSTFNSTADNTTFAPSNGGSLIGVGGEPVCTFCPYGGHVADRQKLFLNDNTQQPFSCGYFDDLFLEFDDLSSCDSALNAFNSTFDPRIYCGCPSTNATGICSTCPNGSDLVTDDRVVINGGTCSSYEDLAASAVTEQFCATVLAVSHIQETCCTISQQPTINPTTSPTINPTPSPTISTIPKGPTTSTLPKSPTMSPSKSPTMNSANITPSPTIGESRSNTKSSARTIRLSLVAIWVTLGFYEILLGFH